MPANDEVKSYLRLKFSEISEEENSGALVVKKESLLKLSACLKDNKGLSFDSLHCLSAVDKKESMELVYIFHSLAHRRMLTVKVQLSKDDLNVDTLTHLWKSADWFEREAYDLFGINFIGHPDLRRILNPEDWPGFPLRKDYAHPQLIKKPEF